jgi:hypothetical protein
MKKLCYFTTAALVLFHLMTAVIGWPGGDEYLLVAKPYPSLLKSIPNMEELNWQSAVQSGGIPSWVANEHYFVLAHGNHELEQQIWERVYSLSILFTIAGLIVACAFVIHILMQAHSSRRLAGKNVA